MIRLLLINSNSSVATTRMMVAIAQAAAGDHAEILGATAQRSPMMIVDPPMLAAAAAEVVEIGRSRAAECSGIIIGAFGDPGCDRLRGLIDIPVIGLAEASMREAAYGHRRFGVATITPKLAHAIKGRAAELGLGDRYTGLRVTQGDPLRLAADPDRLIAALSAAIARCIADDGADAVIIGGGPLGRAAALLAPQFHTPIIAPLPSAVRQLLEMLRRT